jgi:hypothetical protein
MTKTDADTWQINRNPKDQCHKNCNVNILSTFIWFVFTITLKAIYILTFPYFLVYIYTMKSLNYTSTKGHCSFYFGPFVKKTTKPLQTPFNWHFKKVNLFLKKAFITTFCIVIQVAILFLSCIPTYYFPLLFDSTLNKYFLCSLFL